MDTLENFRKAFENLKPIIKRSSNVITIKNKNQIYRVPNSPKQITGIGYTR